MGNIISFLKRCCCFVNKKLKSLSLDVWDSNEEGYIPGLNIFNVSNSVTLTNAYYNAVLIVVGDTQIDIPADQLVDNFTCSIYNHGSNTVTFNAIGGNIYSPDGLTESENGYVVVLKHPGTDEVILTGNLE